MRAGQQGLKDERTRWRTASRFSISRNTYDDVTTWPEKIAFKEILLSATVQGLWDQLLFQKNKKNKKIGGHHGVGPTSSNLTRFVRVASYANVQQCKKFHSSNVAFSYLVVLVCRQQFVR